MTRVAWTKGHGSWRLVQGLLPPPCLGTPPEPKPDGGPLMSPGAVGMPTSGPSLLEVLLPCTPTPPLEEAEVAWLETAEGGGQAAPGGRKCHRPRGEEVLALEGTPTHPSQPPCPPLPVQAVQHSPGLRLRKVGMPSMETAIPGSSSAPPTQPAALVPRPLASERMTGSTWPASPGAPTQGPRQASLGHPAERVKVKVPKVH